MKMIKILCWATVMIISSIFPTLSNDFDGNYDCNRTSLATSGFQNKAAAESWFPKNVVISLQNGESYLFDIKSYKVKYYERKAIAQFRYSGERLKFELKPKATSYLYLMPKDGFQQTAGSGYKCVKTNFGQNITVPNTSANTSSKSKNSKSNLEAAKLTCTELGFVAGTEKHGSCVLKLLER